MRVKTFPGPISENCVTHCAARKRTVLVHCTDFVICCASSDFNDSDALVVGYGSAVAFAITGVFGAANVIGSRNSAKALDASAMFREWNAALTCSGMYICAPASSKNGPARLMSSTGPEITV